MRVGLFIQFLIYRGFSTEEENVNEVICKCVMWALHLRKESTESDYFSTGLQSLL